jgi:hypothetical protein
MRITSSISTSERKLTPNGLVTKIHREVVTAHMNGSVSQLVNILLIVQDVTGSVDTRPKEKRND